MDFGNSPFGSLALALGLGLLIGIDRERSKGSGPTRRFAGIRTFTLVALTGAGTQLLGQDWLIVVAAALVAGLALVSHFKDRSRDPGVTTEIALFVTFLLGVLSVLEPALAAALGVAVASLLAARGPLQAFATRTLTEEELRNALILAGAALIILPLAPNQPLAALAGVNPRTVWLLVVVILAVQMAGDVALRLLGSRLGLALSGLVAGFVSSTATIASMGARAGKRPELFSACVAGAWFSTVSTALQVLLIAAVLSPAALGIMAPAMGSALVVALLLGLAAFRRSPIPPNEDRARGRAFSLRAALLLALLFTGMATAVAWLQGLFGASVVLAATALAGFADMHSAAAAIMALASRGEVEPATMRTGVLLAFSCNSVSKVLAAYAAGGARFGGRVSAGLGLVALAAWGPWAWTRWLG